MKTTKPRSRKAVKPNVRQGRRRRAADARSKLLTSQAPARKSSRSKAARPADARPSRQPGLAVPVKARPAPRRPKPAPAQLPVSIPPILLEGDEPAWQEPAPATKLAPDPTPTPQISEPEAKPLPESYGTGKLTLIARDPHWLYAYWDLTSQQQREYNAASTDRHLVLRVQPGTLAGHPFTEIHVHPESRSWFIHVAGAATRYAAELGYHPANRKWVTVAASGPVETPPDTISRDRTLRFATIPPEVPLREQAVPARLPQAAGPAPAGVPRFADLAESIRRYQPKQQPPSSAEIPEMVRGRIQGEVAPPPFGLQAPTITQAESISSLPGGEAKRPKAFWLNINAELILYGGTEPDALLTIDGKPIALRPDGTFSFRFALPDGQYELAVSAMSTQGDSRQAHLSFVRRTTCDGEVGTAAQDSSLKAPAAENL